MNQESEDQFSQFRLQLYQYFNNQRADTLIELIDALCGNPDPQSVVTLSLSPYFQRDYNSLYKAIAQYPLDRNPEKTARAFQVPVRELFLKAGYLDEPEVTATEEERIEAAFQYILADPDYKLGQRIRGEEHDIKSKRGMVIIYETLTGKRLLSL